MISTARAAGFLLTVVTIGALSACSPAPGGPGDEPGYRLAAINGPLNDAFFVSMQCGADAAAAELGASIDWHNLQNVTDTAPAAQAVSALLLQRPDGFIDGVAAVTEAQVADIADAEIPLVEMNLVTQDKRYYQSFTAPQKPTEQLNELAQLIVDNAGGEGSVAILGGVPGLQLATDRYQPLIDELHRIAPQLTVLDPQFDEIDTGKAAQITAALILANPDLKAVYSITGPAGAGAVQAVGSAGKTGEILVYSYDGTPGNVAALKAGEMSGLLSQSPYLFGERAVEALVGLLDDGGSATDVADPQDVLLPLMVLTADNVDSDEASDFVYVESCG